MTIVGCSGSTSIGASSDATQGTGNESSAAATAAPSEPVTINTSPDKYNFYVRDYVGRNLAECGYISLANKLTDAYGSAYITFDITADDGAYIELPDSSDENADKEDVNFLSQYVVTAQSVAPNTQVTATYLTDSNGNEYSNLIDTQSVESIALTVTKIPE